ncbi:MAG: proton-conducting transporter membrane subunit [Acidobacteriota bacterium]
MSGLLLTALVLPGVAGVVLWLSGSGASGLRRIALGFALPQLVVAVAILRATARGEILVHGFGGWAPPFGIVFVADRLAALFVVLLAVLLLATLWALRPKVHGEEAVARSLPPLFLLVFGLNGSFLTGDLFNLFVMFEVVLLSSYLLLQVPGGERSLSAAYPNIAINLVAALLFFIGVGLIYGATGTVNLAGIAEGIGDADPALRTAAIAMLVVAFSVKAGLIPFLYWLPATYPVLKGPVAALFAGMMTKLGVYALARTLPLFMRDTPIPSILVWVGAASSLIAVIAALSEFELRRLLGFHITSQVGYMVLGLALLSHATIAGALFYLVHHVLVKTALFFVADDLERTSETRDLRSMTAGAAGPAVAFAFVVAGFSLAGLPPFSGFFAKLGLLRGLFVVSEWALLGVLLVASIFTLASMLKVWLYAFGAPASAESTGWWSSAPLLGMVALSIALAVSAGPVFAFAEATATQLLQVDDYLAAVASVQDSRIPAGLEVLP